MSRFSPSALVAALSVAGIVSRFDLVSQVDAFQLPQQRTLPSLSTTSSSSTKLNAFNINTQGDIGDNLYLNSPTSRAQSSTYRSLFAGPGSESATQPANNYQFRSNNNGGQRNNKGLFGRIGKLNTNNSNNSYNNNLNRRNAGNTYPTSNYINNYVSRESGYGNAAVPSNGGYSNYAGGNTGTNRYQGGVGSVFANRSNNNNNYNGNSGGNSWSLGGNNRNYNRNNGVRLSDAGKTRSGGWNGNNRNNGVRLSDVGKYSNNNSFQRVMNTGNQRNTSPRSFQKQYETQAQLETQERARRERERIRREKDERTRREREQRQFEARQRSERARIERERKNEQKRIERERKQVVQRQKAERTRMEQQRKNEAKRIERERKNAIKRREREMTQFNRRENVALGSGYNNGYNRYSSAYNNYGSSYRGTSSSGNFFSQLGRLDSPLWNGGNNYNSPQRNYFRSNSNAYNGINAVGQSNNGVRLSDIGKGQYQGRSWNGVGGNQQYQSLPQGGNQGDFSRSGFGRPLGMSNTDRQYTDSFVSAPGRSGSFRQSSRRPMDFIDADYYRNSKGNSDVWGGVWKGPTENSLMNLVPYGVGKRIANNARNNPYVYSDNVNGNNYRNNSYRPRKASLLDKAQMFGDKQKLKNDIKKLENKVVRRKAKLGVDTYEYRDQLQQEYYRFVDDLRRGVYDERDFDERIARYTEKMKSDQERRIESLTSSAQRDIDNLFNRIEKKEMDLESIEIAERGGVRDARRDAWGRQYNYNDYRRNMNRLDRNRVDRFVPEAPRRSGPMNQLPPAQQRMNERAMNNQGQYYQ